MKRIRLILADDNTIYRYGLRAVFSGQADIQLVAEAVDANEVLTQVQCCRADVVLLKMGLAGGSCRQLIEQIRRKDPTTKVVVMSLQREEQYAIPMLRGGAKGFISKMRTPAELLEATRKVAAGDVYLSPDLAHKIAVGALDGTAPAELHDRLSQREREVLQALAAGLSVTTIAKQFHLSPKTISTHKSRIFQKLGVENLSQLVRYALERGLT